MCATLTRNKVAAGGSERQLSLDFSAAPYSRSGLEKSKLKTRDPHQPLPALCASERRADPEASEVYVCRHCRPHAPCEVCSRGFGLVPRR
jgi:hypothetical protein